MFASELNQLDSLYSLDGWQKKPVGRRIVAGMKLNHGTSDNIGGIRMKRARGERPVRAEQVRTKR